MKSKNLRRKIQKSTDKYIKEVDAAVDAKSKEIMTVYERKGELHECGPFYLNEIMDRNCGSL